MKNRREFFKLMGMGAAVIGVNSVASPVLAASAPKQTNNKKPKISFQEGIVPGKSLDEKLDFMEKLGVTGLEVGGQGLAGRVEKIQQALKGRSIKISAVCAGFGGWLMAEEEGERNYCINDCKEILTAAGDLGAAGMILVPVFNHQKPSYPNTWESRKKLIEHLKELGEYAVKNNTSLILEPLNRGETSYLRMVADAAAICKDAGDGVMCMGDFWHMTWEETSDLGAIISGGKYINHMHIASRKRRLIPGEDGESDNYIDGFKGLKHINYNGYISFECGSKHEDRAVALTNAVNLIHTQWKKA